jgi:chorismate mutase
MATRKPTKPVTAAAEKTEIVDTITSLYTTGVERIAEVQKKGIDLAVKQNAELLDAWKKIAQAVPGAPGLFMLDLASNAFERYADTQKGAIDLVLEQSHALADLVKERATATAEALAGAPAIVKQTVDQSVAAQKKALDYSAAQSKAAFASAREQFGIKGTPAETAAETFERGVDSLIESQKELLDIAAKPFATIH